MIVRVCFKILLFLLVSLCQNVCLPFANAQSSSRVTFENGRLVYGKDALGNRIPDYSYCGYKRSEVPLPNIAAKVRVEPITGDATKLIQSAIDFISQQPPDDKGFRGALEFSAGTFEIHGQLKLNHSGIVLRGTTINGQQKTILRATGRDRRALIRIAGYGQPVRGDVYAIRNERVPLGSNHLILEPTANIHPGMSISVTHPSTREWIHSLEMDQFPTDDKGSWLDWHPKSLDSVWEREVRKVTAVESGLEIEFDVPLTMPFHSALSRAHIQRTSWPDRISAIGIESLSLQSESKSENSKDEEHAWDAIRIEKAADCWVRDVTSVGFVGSMVSIDNSARCITVLRCKASSPKSELAAFRRRTFYTCGEQTLFMHCTSDSGLHDFSVGYLAPGPNAFVHCSATQANDFSGTIESWSTGVLLDNVSMDGGGIALTNRETDGQGIGWTTCGSMLWQCTAPVITCRNPPGYENWAYGCWGGFVGNGRWKSMNEFVDPDSLFEQQLLERSGSNLTTLQLAVPRSLQPLETIVPVWNELFEQKLAPELKGKTATKQSLRAEGGWLLVDGKLVSGDRIGTMWWRGSMLPSRTSEFGVGVTRFAPCRSGDGFTDDLDELTDTMLAKNQRILEHHWGLWYDRRRDDHEMIRRIDGEVWAPFYEQPWARSGSGTAWDGLSKYDLESFNPWYFKRLNEFAGHCDAKGLILLQQMYFQHNILEAGAHWADFPWRSANCLQSVGFIEPPPYVNKKRIFQANEFYDVSHPVRRALHEKYIHHCLDNMLDRTNVIFSIGEEFTGPEHFVRFWLDSIRTWKESHPNTNPMISLSCTKDVQDSILNDPKYASLIHVIDLKYWWYVSDGSLYAPLGDKNLAPRQHLREWKGQKGRSDFQTAKQIAEYRFRFPEKAVLTPHRTRSPWPIVASGGSIPIATTQHEFSFPPGIAEMRPFDTAVESCVGIAELGKSYLLYSETQNRLHISLAHFDREFCCVMLDSVSGKPISESRLQRGKDWDYEPEKSGPMLIWIHSNDSP